MKQSFNFSGLPMELQFAVVDWIVDLPSLLALSLVCVSFRRTFWKIKSFDNWDFLDECARRGWLSLIEWAIENGSLLDVSVLEEAVKADRRSTADWLYRALLDKHSISFNFGFLLKDHAALNGNRALVFSKDTSGTVFSRTLACRAAEGGHVELALELKALTINWFQSDFLSSFAAKGGHLEATKRLHKAEGSLPGVVEAILEKGCDGGHVDIVAYAIAEGAVPHEIHLQKKGTVSRLEMIDYFYRHFPDLVVANLSRIAYGACYSPNVEVFRWLATLGYEFRDEYTRLLLSSGYSELNLHNHLAESTMGDGVRRFECIKFIYECGKLWDAKALEFVPCDILCFVSLFAI